MRSLLPLLLLSACEGAKTDDSGTVQPREFSDCDPLSYEKCYLPFPSTYYMREDAESPTGWRVHLGAATIPVTDQGEIAYQPAPDYWNERDGFSPMAPLIAEFPELALDGLPDHDHIADSLLETSPVVVVDADTGERMPVWAELDMSDMTASKRMLLIYPAVPLRNSHRYVVGLRNLKNGAGSPIAASEAFAALRDGTATQNWDIEGRRELYDGIFTALEGQGWSRGEVQLAWDLVIASPQGIAGKAEVIRDGMRAAVADGTVGYVVDSVEDEVNENTYRRVHGHLTNVPLYTDADKPPTFLNRDPQTGMPYASGTTEVPFTIVIPRTAVENPRPLPLLQYGHGLLGGQDEVHSGYLGEMANRYGFIPFAVDWTGMKSEDADAIVEMILTNIDHFAMIPERSQQGFGEFFAAADMMRGAIAADASVAFPDGAGNMVSVFDTSTLYYYGNSQGGILGGAYMGLQPDITRGVLGVGGAPYALLLYRSADFAPFFVVFKAVYKDSRDIALWMVLMQMLWDSGEGAGFGRQMYEEPLDGLPQHQILMQTAIGDAQVTTLGGQMAARAYGASLIETPVRPVWGMETQASGWEGPALVEVDFGVPAVPFTNVPPDSEYDTHEDTRRNPPSQEQLWTFLTTGQVVNYCDGACDPD
ncbi:MAG TPA: hypothetical protein PLA94_04875 [Myxococcota bacterium]|nr:hypothetical protein [Myxococcota bacterium]